MKRLSQEQVMYKHLEDHLEEWVSQTALDEAVFSAHGRRCGDATNGMWVTRAISCHASV